MNGGGHQEICLAGNALLSCNMLRILAPSSGKYPAIFWAYRAPLGATMGVEVPGSFGAKLLAKAPLILGAILGPARPEDGSQRALKCWGPNCHQKSSILIDCMIQRKALVRQDALYRRMYSAAARRRLAHLFSGQLSALSDVERLRLSEYAVPMVAAWQVFNPPPSPAKGCTPFVKWMGGREEVRAPRQGATRVMGGSTCSVRVSSISNPAHWSQIVSLQ